TFGAAQRRRGQVQGDGVAHHRAQIDLVAVYDVGLVGVALTGEQLVDLDLEHAPHGLETAPALPFPGGSNGAGDHDPVAHRFELELDTHRFVLGHECRNDDEIGNGRFSREGTASGGLAAEFDHGDPPRGVHVTSWSNTAPSSWPSGSPPWPLPSAKG